MIRQPKLIILALALSFFLAFSSQPTYGNGMTLNVGPLSGGQGGSNPLSIPPLNFAEYQLIYTTAQNSEFVLGLIPGIFYGVRTSERGPFYASLGAGLVIGYSGAGPGVMSSVGMNVFCSLVCLNLEFRQAIAPSGKSLISPFAVRIGAAKFW